jgi:hypothetical protein
MTTATAVSPTQREPGLPGQTVVVMARRTTSMAVSNSSRGA